MAAHIFPLGLITTFTLYCCSSSDEGKSSTRAEFGRAMNLIQASCDMDKGVLASEIVRVLGRPDDIWTRHDASQHLPTGINEIWCYGTNGHLTFPTLGRVYIDRQGTAKFVDGGFGDPPAQELFEETDLRTLLRLMDTAPSINASQYDPLAMIRIVNTLQPLGKKKVLAAAAEYLRVAPRRSMDLPDRILAVLDVLFELPETLGGAARSFPGAPPTVTLRPPGAALRSRIVLADDVPLLLPLPLKFAFYSELRADGPTESPLARFRDQGQLRPKPLLPTSSPLRLYGVLQKDLSNLYDKESSSWPAMSAKLAIMNQLLRLVDSVCRREADVSGYRLTKRDETEARWKQILAEADALDIHWDIQKNRYTFKDGSTLPDPVLKVYRREIWKLESIDGDAEVTVERVHKGHISIGLSWSGKPGTKIAWGSLRVYDVMNKKVPLDVISLRRLASAALLYDHFSEGFYLALREGQQIQLELTTKRGSTTSQVYKP